MTDRFPRSTGGGRPGGSPLVLLVLFLLLLGVARHLAWPSRLVGDDGCLLLYRRLGDVAGGGEGGRGGQRWRGRGVGEGSDGAGAESGR